MLQNIPNFNLRACFFNIFLRGACPQTPQHQHTIHADYTVHNTSQSKCPNFICVTMSDLEPPLEKSGYGPVLYTYVCQGHIRMQLYGHITKSKLKSCCVSKYIACNCNANLMHTTIVHATAVFNACISMLCGKI